MLKETAKTVITKAKLTKRILSAQAKIIKQAYKAYNTEGANIYNIIGETKYQGTTVHLVLSDIVLADMGDLPGAKIFYTPWDHTAVIFFNEAMTNQPRYIQEAALAHELGHLAHDHLNQPQTNLVKANIGRHFGSKEAIKRELEADDYAIQNGHKKGLADFLNYLKTQGLDSKELKIRRSILNQ